MLLNNTLGLVGSTPIVRLKKLFPNHQVFAKLENLNLTHSVKVRVAFYAIEKLLEEGGVKKGGTIIVPTSGNTGLGVIAASKFYGLNPICVLFDSVPVFKVSLMESYGAKVVKCPSNVKSNEEGGYVWKAKKLSQEIENSYLFDQFSSSLNNDSHFFQTAPEILKQFGSREIGFFFSTIGTGGTISGVGKALKEHSAFTQVIGVDPFGGLYKDYFEGREGLYKNHCIESISDNFISPNFKKEYVDKVLNVLDVDGVFFAKQLLDKESIFAGPSSGLLFKGIDEYLKSEKVSSDTVILGMVTDTGYNYQLTSL